jgi:ABC-type bacteriocin/lantibiotic exporter with double-glycine peptidase domain
LDVPKDGKWRESVPNFDVPMIGQQNSKCCWLACYQMLYGWQKKSTSEPTTRAQSAGLSITEGLDSSDWAKARDAMGLTSYRVSYLTEQADNLINTLYRHGPMWCAGNFLNGSPHAIVISGYDGETLRISDPFEIYKYYSYNWLTWSGWRKLVKNYPFACQVWF